MTRGRKITLKNGLTPRENAFKDVVLKQIAQDGEVNATAAAMEVYNPKNRGTAKTIGYEVMSKPHVKEEIQRALESEGLTASKIIKNIGNMANATPDSYPANVVLKSNQDLLRIMGGYPDSKKPNISLNLTAKIKNMGYDEAKVLYDQLNSEVNELIKDSE